MNAPMPLAQDTGVRSGDTTARLSKVDPAALAELRNAAATYDFLRAKKDPAQFWEMLRLARSRRALVPDESGKVVPTPALEAGLTQELQSVRRHFGPMVADLRALLKNAGDLPQPSDRLELALAFLLASTREHQAIAKWLAEPQKHVAKAAEKLRSLASITDPYREALLPWSLDAGSFEKAEFSETPEAAPGPGAPASVPAPAGASTRSMTDGETMLTLRCAIRCCDILSDIYIESEFWEALLLAVCESAPTRESLQRLNGLKEKGQAADYHEAARMLFSRLLRFRSKNVSWVHPLKELVARIAPPEEDPLIAQIALGLLVVSADARERIRAWIESPGSRAEEAGIEIRKALKRAKAYLAVL